MKKVPNLRFLIFPYLALVVIHLVLSIGVRQPFMFADELGYLGNARYLAGVAHLPDMRNMPFYHFGYSLFLLPAFWLFTSPLAIYKVVIATNAFLMSSLYFALYYILHGLFDCARKQAALVAFVVCLYPAFLLQSNLAWAESAFIPCYAFLVVAFSMFLRRRSYWSAVVLGALSGFLYTIHPRGLPVFLITVVVVAVLACVDRVPRRQATVSLSVATVIFVITRLVNAHLNVVGWGGGGESYIFLRLAQAMSLTEVSTLALRACGQILYLCQATYGLFLIGVLVVGSELKRCWQSRNDVTGYVLLFVVLTAGGIFFVSSLIMIPATRADHLIYGRYNEGFLAIPLALALAFWPRTPLWATGAIIALIGSLTLVTLWGNGYSAFETPLDPSEVHLNPPMVLGLFPFVQILQRLDLAVISLVTILTFLVLQRLFTTRVWVGYLCLVVLFGAMNAYIHKHLFLFHQSHVPRSTTLASHIQNLGPVATVSYDMTFFDVRAFSSYQYLLPEVRFERFSSGKGESPSSPVVISGKEWQDADKFAARFVVGENGVDNAIWVLPGDEHLHVPTVDFVNQTFGVMSVAGVQEAGFYASEGADGHPVRWTNGTAKLVIPLVDGQRHPTALEIKLASTGPQGTTLRVLVNEHELFHERLPAGNWAQTLDLKKVPLGERITIALLSDTFVPQAVMPGSRDTRTLGVYVQSIRLLG